VADYEEINYVLLHVHSLFSFHSASSEAYTSFFQIGVEDLRVSIAYWTASRDSDRCGEDTAITTLASITGTMPNLNRNTTNQVNNRRFNCKWCSRWYMVMVITEILDNVHHQRLLRNSYNSIWFWQQYITFKINNFKDFVHLKVIKNK